MQSIASKAASLIPDMLPKATAQASSSQSCHTYFRCEGTGVTFWCVCCKSCWEFGEPPNCYDWGCTPHCTHCK